MKAKEIFFCMLGALPRFAEKTVCFFLKTQQFKSLEKWLPYLR